MTRRIAVEVFDAPLSTDALTSEGTLSNDRQRAFFEDLRGVGSWSVTVPLGSADDTKLAYDRIVRFSVDGTNIGWGKVERRVRTIDKGVKELTVSGRGALCLMDDAVLYPRGGLGRHPDVRRFNWTSPDFDDSAWDDATELKQQADPAEPWSTSPVEFPDPDAYWIGVPDGATVNPPGPLPLVGDYLLRKSYTIATGTEADFLFDAAADDQFVAYHDEESVAEVTEIGRWGEQSQFWDLRLDNGSHLWAIKVTNAPREAVDVNVTAFLLSMSTAVSGGKLGDVIINTDGTWKLFIVDPDDGPPGMTPGQGAEIFLVEAFDRAGGSSSVAHINTGHQFSDSEDAAGDPWGKTPDLAIQVGTKGTEFLARYTAEDAAEWSLHPDPVSTVWAEERLILQGWNRKGNPTSGVTIAYADNLGTLTVDGHTAGPNVGLTRTADGRYVETEDTSASTTWGRKETFLSLGTAASDAAGDRQAQTYLDDNAEPAEVITSMRVVVPPGGPVPWEDVVTGDGVTVTDTEGSYSERVTGIHLSEDAAGNPIYDLDLEPV